MTESESEESGGETAQEHEYRITGCVGGSFRATEWGDRESTVEAYEEADWSLIGIERRVPEDDSTIQRQPTPDGDDWIDVTENKIHIKSEEVAEA